MSEALQGQIVAFDLDDRTFKIRISEKHPQRLIFLGVQVMAHRQEVELHLPTPTTQAGGPADE